MNNILNNNNRNIKFRLSNDKYIDFCLCKDDNRIDLSNSGLSENCLISYIDINDPDCVWFDNIFSKNGYVWSKSINSGITLYNIGFTGVDNGIISFEKDRITNKKFFELFTSSVYSVKENDFRLILHKITGNTQLYIYPSYIINEEGFTSLKLNGGFYQGFFKTYGYDYQVLPSVINVGWTFEFVLNKKEFEHEDGTILNDTHPNNKGIFFYIGTRAENKWWTLYDGKPNDIVESKNNLQYDSNDGYCDDGYFKENGQNINDQYVKGIEEEKEEYFSDDYLNDYDKNSQCISDYSYFNENYMNENYYNDICNCNYYFKDDYIEEEETIDEKENLYTNNGYSISTPNIYEIETDNKFIFFNRTCTGFTTENWDDENNVVLTGITSNNNANYFTLFNRTCTGLTAGNVPDEIKYDTSYNIENDIIDNAIAFMIKDDGSIGYRYLTYKCEDDKKIDVVEEFTKPGIISNDKWHTIDVSILTNHANKYMCENMRNGKMKLLFYVDGKLKLVSKELEELKLKGLNDIKEKQESVAFNISLGGGTQGLADMISLNYMKYPEFVFPLEKYFAGTFIGEIRSFKFYDCKLNYNEISNNVEFEENYIKK